jgi:flagellar biosynthesis protein FlhG
VPPARALLSHVCVMPVLVSIASGKGGVGKSAAVCNLGLLLARLGRRVVLADLDVGGANLHVMLGTIAPERTLSDFLTRRVGRLADALQPVPYCRNLRLLAGAAESLETVNPHHASRSRLLREIGRLEADVVIVDLGAGTSNATLDGFLASDVQIAVATPDATSVVDVYTLLKLAAVRRVQQALGARSAIGSAVARQEFASIEAPLEAARTIDPEADARARAALDGFRPQLLLNRTGNGGVLNLVRLNSTLRRYLGAEATLLGQIPEDPAMARAARALKPVTEHDPESPAGRAYLEAARRLIAAIPRQPRPFEPARATAAASATP